MIFGQRQSSHRPSFVFSGRTGPDVCARLHTEGFAHPWSREEMAALIASSSTVGAAALDPVNGRLRGFVLSRLAADEAEILAIAVEPAFQGRGVGRALGENLRQTLALRTRRSSSRVAKDNAPALALYERFGFVKVRERAGYTAAPTEPAPRPSSCARR